MQSATRMETIILLFVAVLQFAIAQQHSRTWSTVIIPGPVKGNCPSTYERENALLAIRNNITALFTNASIIPECGDGLWYQVAYLNMTDPAQQCPSAWWLYEPVGTGVRVCKRPDTNEGSCPATFYPTGRQYSKVCERIIGYQRVTPGAFDIGNSVPSNIKGIVSCCKG